MQKRLFLLCPTDTLESTINKISSGDNYFYTSLGNSFDVDSETLQHIKELVDKQEICKIYFVLSNDNKIILDALGGQFFSHISGLKKCYKEVKKQQRNAEIIEKSEGSQFSILSYYLNRKRKELQFQLDHLCAHDVAVSAKIYNKQENSFRDIYADLICLERHSLN